MNTSFVRACVCGLLSFKPRRLTSTSSFGFSLTLSPQSTAVDDTVRQAASPSRLQGEGRRAAESPASRQARLASDKAARRLCPYCGFRPTALLVVFVIGLLCPCPRCFLLAAHMVDTMNFRVYELAGSMNFSVVAHSPISVSYTHLTLPTNREV